MSWAWAVPLLLAGCATAPPPGAARPSATTAPVTPAAPATADCRPVTLRVEGLVIDATDCRLATGHWRVQVEPALPGLALWRDGERIGTVLQLFAKAPGDGVSSILPTLRARGLVPDDDDCRFEPAPPGPALRPMPRTVAVFQIRPTGERLRRLQATPADQIPDPPCGAVGWSTHGVRWFMTDLRQPGWVVYVDEGQDGTQIDPRSIRWE